MQQRRVEDLPITRAIFEIFKESEVKSRDKIRRQIFSEEEKNKFGEEVRELVKTKTFQVLHELISAFLKFSFNEKNNVSLSSEDTRLAIFNELTKWGDRREDVSFYSHLNSKELLAEILNHIGCSVSTATRRISDTIRRQHGMSRGPYLFVKESIIEIFTGVNNEGQKIPAFAEDDFFSVASRNLMFKMLYKCTCYYLRRNRMSVNAQNNKNKGWSNINRKRKLDEPLPQGAVVNEKAVLPPFIQPAVTETNNPISLMQENEQLKLELALVREQLEESQLETRELGVACEKQKTALTQLVTPIYTRLTQQERVSAQQQSNPDPKKSRVGTRFHLYQPEPVSGAASRVSHETNINKVDEYQWISENKKT